MGETVLSLARGVKGPGRALGGAFPNKLEPLTFPNLPGQSKRVNDRAQAIGAETRARWQNLPISMKLYAHACRMR